MSACPPRAHVARLHEVSLRYGKTQALDAVSLEVPAGCMVGVIGPDGVGKSSLFSLVAVAHAIQSGTIEVLGGDMADVRHRREVCPRVAYMPQGLGKNLYPTLSVSEGLSPVFVVRGRLAVPIEGSTTLFLAGTALHLFATTSMGIFLATLARSMPHFALLAFPVCIVMNLLSGGTTPLDRQAAVLADGHEGLTSDAFCAFRPGYPVPWGGLRHRVAGLRGDRRHWCSVLRRRLWRFRTTLTAMQTCMTSQNGRPSVTTGIVGCATVLCYGTCTVL